MQYAHNVGLGASYRMVTKQEKTKALDTKQCPYPGLPGQIKTQAQDLMRIKSHSVIKFPTHKTGSTFTEVQYIKTVCNEDSLRGGRPCSGTATFSH